MRVFLPAIFAVIGISILSSAYAIEAVIPDAGIVLQLSDAWAAKTERTKLPSGQWMQRWVRSPVKAGNGSASPGLIAIATPVQQDAKLALLTREVLSGRPYGVKLGAETTCIKCVTYKIDTPAGIVTAIAPDMPDACKDTTGQSNMHDCVAINQVNLGIEPSWAHTFEKATPAGTMKVMVVHLLANDKLVDLSFWYPAEAARAVEEEIFPMIASMRKKDGITRDSAGLAGSNKDEQEALQRRWQLLAQLLDELPVRQPDGIVLKSLRQSGSQVIFSGYAESDALMSEFMRRLQEGGRFSPLELKEIKSVMLQSRQLREFALHILPLPQSDRELNQGGRDTCGRMPPLLAADNSPDIPLAEMNMAGLVHDLQFELFKPGRETPKRGFAEQRTEISLSGDYNNLRRFVHAISHAPSLIVISDFSVSYVRETQLRMDAVATSYRSLGGLRLASPIADKSQQECANRKLDDVSDPFSFSRLKTASVANAHGGPERKKEPLEQFPLESLSFIGTPKMPGNPFGMVRAGKNVYPVRVGNYMGQHSGRITRITEREIVLLESVSDGSGGYVERNNVLPLQQEN